MSTALEGGEGSASRPARSLPSGKTRYPFYGRLGGPQGRSRQVQKISLPPGFDPRTLQPVASRYTDWATRPTNIMYCHNIPMSSFHIIPGSARAVNHFEEHWIHVTGYAGHEHKKIWKGSCFRVTHWTVQRSSMQEWIMLSRGQKNLYWRRWTDVAVPSQRTFLYLSSVSLSAPVVNYTYHS